MRCFTQKIKDYGRINGKKLYVMEYIVLYKLYGASGHCVVLRYGNETLLKVHGGSFLVKPHISVSKKLRNPIQIIRKIVSTVKAFQECLDYLNGKLISDYTKCELYEDNKTVELVYSSRWIILLPVEKILEVIDQVVKQNFSIRTKPNIGHGRKVS